MERAAVVRMPHGAGACARWARAAVAALSLLLAACGNSPWPADAPASNTLFTAMVEGTPRHLDPTASYWSNDTPVTYQVYEPPYGYHYLKRPFVLEPKTAVEVVRPRYLDREGRPLPDDAPGELVAESVYELRIRPGIMYQPHPAFAQDGQGAYRYHALRPGELGTRRTPWDFEHQGTRELVAEDYVYALKRHATTRITTPIAGIFAEHVVGLEDYMALVKAEDARLLAGHDPASLDKPFLDFRRWPLAGASAPEKHLLRLRIQGKYPQWSYWMTMTFMAPVPWEADAFYAQPGMAARSLTLDRWPVGTGPYMLREFVTDQRIVLERNPHYRRDPYPCEGMPGDAEAGLLDDCGRPTPFIDRIVATVEKEAVPMKGKFRQGYYDIEVFERVDTGLEYLVEMDDAASVRAEYQAKGFRLSRFADISSWMIGFNMLDPVLGQGDTPERQQRNRKLRQAISIAIDWEEFSRIFPRKSGETAMDPLPGGIFGSRHGTPEGMNPVTHRQVQGRVVRRPIEDARRLMVEAGYPDGREAASGRPLVLHYDFYAQPTPERKAEIDWVTRQFAKLGIQLDVRATDNNQFQDKVRRGTHQIYWLGWLADYPDAENFLFLLYGPNGKTRSDGENTSNYENAEFDRLFARLKLMDDGPEKQAVIDRMNRIVQEDAPWSFGYFPYSSAAVQSWLHNARPTVLIRDPGRYMRLDTEARVAALAAWNRPVWWPVLLGLLAGAALLGLAWHSLRQRERLTAHRRVT